MLHAVAGKPAQNLLRLGRAQTKGGREFDHLVVVLPNEFPPDRSCEDRLQIRIGIRLARFGAVELLRVEIFQARQQLEAQ